MLSAMSPDEVVKLMGELDQFSKDQEYLDEMGGLFALMASREIVIDHASATDPARVLLGLVEEGGGAKNEAFYADVMRSWAARDPVAACRFFEQTTLNEEGIDAKSVAGALVRELVKTDPDGAFRWLRGLKADFTDDVAHDALQTGFPQASQSRVRSASAAARASASFLLLPLPVASTSVFHDTSAWKTRRWSGPLSPTIR
jgi:hypothetical protein